MRAAIYVRVSLEDGRRTVENQRLQLSEYCGRMGWVVAADLAMLSRENLSTVRRTSA
jgi:DNA invertase Pin-like site-specific DNA recombinase